MTVTFVPTLDAEKIRPKTFTIDLAKNDGNYTIAEVSLGDILILDRVVHVTGAGAGFTDVSIFVNNDPKTYILTKTEGEIVKITEGSDIKESTEPISVPEGGKIRYSMTGNGTAGELKLHIRYQPMVAGVVIE